jgi:predicted RNase H-like HicB family nuclease
MRYMVVIEEGPTSFGAYVPDLPGCIAVGESSKEALQLIQEAIGFHIEGLKEEGQRIRMPHSSSSFIDVQA